MREQLKQKPNQHLHWFLSSGPESSEQHGFCMFVWMLSWLCVSSKVCVCVCVNGLLLRWGNTTDVPASTDLFISELAARPQRCHNPESEELLYTHTHTHALCWVRWHSLTKRRRVKSTGRLEWCHILSHLQKTVQGPTLEPCLHTSTQVAFREVWTRSLWWESGVVPLNHCCVTTLTLK